MSHGGSAIIMLNFPRIVMSNVLKSHLTHCGGMPKRVTKDCEFKLIS